MFFDKINVSKVKKLEIYKPMEISIIIKRTKEQRKEIITNVDKNCSVVKYIYDDYEVITVKTGRLKDTVVIKNSYRYRSYSYDEETGYYYLQSRYYSPFLKRFISLDETAILDATKGKILGANLYAYCNNNPIMNEDPSGYLTLSKFWVALSLDILFACLIPAVASAYDFIGRGIKFTMKAIAKKQGLRAAKSIARKKIKTFSFGIANKLMTSLRYAMRKLFKITISNAWTASFTSLLGKILNSVDILSNFLSLGSMIACFLDFVSDGKFNNKIKIF